jgi:glycosyltransferase involved in cell wall biosynthesis
MQTLRDSDSEASATQPDSLEPSAGKRLRVLLFTNSVAIGGMEKHAAMIAHDLDAHVAEVYAICPEWAEIDPWAEQFCGLVHASARITPDRRYGQVRQLRETARMWRQLRDWRIDVMHMHLTSYHGGTWALLAARLAGVKTVLCTEHLPPEQPLSRVARTMRDRFTRDLDGVVCVSEVNRKARAAHIYTPDDKTTVVNNGIDVSGFTPSSAAETAELRQRLGIPADAPVVGTVVRFVEEKGLPYLMAAMPRVLERVPNARLLMVGDGPLRADLERQAQEFGYSDRVIITGFQEDPRPFLSLIDAFVLPVPFGSASIGLLEAMAMSRAVVITFGEEGDAVIDGETGLRPPPRNPEALAEAILRVITDPDFEQYLGTQARQRIEEHFSSKSMAAQLLRLYQRTHDGSRTSTTDQP